MVAAPAIEAVPETPSEREAAGRRQVEEAEHLRSMRADAEREATERAAQALADEKRLSAEQSAALERLKHAEAAVGDAKSRVRDVNQRLADAQTRVDKRVEVLRSVIPIVIRMSEYPLETLLAARVPAEDAVRGILVLRTIARQAETDARALVAERKVLDVTSRTAEQAVVLLASAETARSRETDALARELDATRARRTEAEQAAAEAAGQAAAEAARADSLRSMLSLLETQRRLSDAQAREDALLAERDKHSDAAESARLREAATGRPAVAGTIAADAKPAGQIIPPVIGTLVRGWGESDNGEPATGQSWRAQPSARVMAPCGGTVAFAEPFHSYGLLVIIDCGGGYHAVLSGMDQITVAPGRAIQPGDIIGTMKDAPRTASAGPATPIEPPVLYFELRKGGRPVDPAPWLRPPS
jgi:septal ring factor EnvC (AmiA/AmiB activator)